MTNLPLPATSATTCTTPPRSGRRRATKENYDTMFVCHPRLEGISRPGSPHRPTTLHSGTSIWHLILRCVGNRSHTFPATYHSFHILRQKLTDTSPTPHLTSPHLTIHSDSHVAGLIGVIPTFRSHWITTTTFHDHFTYDVHVDAHFMHVGRPLPILTFRCIISSFSLTYVKIRNRLTEGASGKSDLSESGNSLENNRVRKMFGRLTTFLENHTSMFPLLTYPIDSPDRYDYGHNGDRADVDTGRHLHSFT